MPHLLHSGFLRSVERMPGRIALVVQGQELTYAELHERARRIAATIQQHADDGPRLTAVFGERSPTTFAGILGALMAGHAYVPLNPGFPMARTRQMLSRAGCRTLIVDSSPGVAELLEGLKGVTVIPPDAATVPAARLHPADDWVPVQRTPEDLAYLLFTSGSTGAPKGVMVSHRNAAHFVRSAVKRYAITAGDRLSQLFDTTFDLSVFDMFVAWHQGATVCCPPRSVLWNPSAFAHDQRLTVWFSVPSVAMMMGRLGALKSESFPTLRWSLFCGERLPVDVAKAWAAAAPNSVVENLYGPTELTVACTAYRWNPCASPAESEAGVVPIGHALPGMYAVVVDEHLVEVQPGEVGELLVTGPQRMPGYWQDEAATGRALVRINGWADYFYRTGDRVRRPVEDEPFRFIGRLDHQVKVRGYRVELGEVEFALRQIEGVDAAAAVGSPEGIAAFVTGTNLEPDALCLSLRSTLPDFAIPRTIRLLPSLPLNSNGKLDRGALEMLLDA